MKTVKPFELTKSRWRFVRLTRSTKNNKESSQDSISAAAIHVRTFPVFRRFSCERVYKFSWLRKKKSEESSLGCTGFWVRVFSPNVLLILT